MRRSGAVAQLGERLAGSQKVRGSSPLGSIRMSIPAGAGRESGGATRPRPATYAPTIVIVRRTSAVVAVFAVTVTR